MNPAKSKPTARLARSVLAAIAMAVLGASSATAQRGASDQVGAQGAARQTGMTPEQAFAGGVQRDGAVGQSTTVPVGASATSAAGAAAGGAAGRAGRALGGGFGGGGLGAAFGNLFNTNAARSSTATPPLRTRLRSAVDVPPGLAPSQTMRQYSAESRLHHAPTLQPRGTGSAASVQGRPPTTANPYAGVNVQIQDRTAILQGTVAEERDRRMSELLMRLEPGVSRVRNQIRVAP